MKSWIALILAAVLGAAWYAGYLQPERWREAVAKPEVLYRWKDDKGQLSYGTKPPAGKVAERVNAEDRMSVISPPPAKPVVTAPLPNASGAQELKRKLMDKAIEGSP